MSISDGLGSRKQETLADTIVTLARGDDGFVASEIIKKMLKVNIDHEYKLTNLVASFPGFTRALVLRPIRNA